MFISNILKQNKATKEIKDKLENNIQKTSDLVRAILPEEVINANEDQIKEALHNFETQNQTKDTEKETKISFKYPEKTLQQAELDYCRKVKDAELEFGREYTTWNQQMYTAHQQSERADDQNSEIRIQTKKPYYMAPSQTVVKVGQTHFELQFETRRNPLTNNMEILSQSMEILERRDTNDIKMEDNCIKYEGTDKKTIDWETTLLELKAEGQNLGYSKNHFLKCLLRILSQHDSNRFEILKMENDPEIVANNLMAKYRSINKKKMLENKLKTLTRKTGESIREVMCQADSLTDRILAKCKPEEKAFRKYQLMIDALKSFTSEDNSKELVIALKESALTEERPDICELINAVELAEKVNETSRPSNDRTFMNERTLEKCEIFAVNPEEECNMIKKFDDMMRSSNDRRQESHYRSNSENNSTRNHSDLRGRSQTRDDRRSLERNNSQNYHDRGMRRWSKDRNRGRSNQSSIERSRWYDEDINDRNYRVMRNRCIEDRRSRETNSHRTRYSMDREEMERKRQGCDREYYDTRQRSQSREKYRL